MIKFFFFSISKESWLRRCMISILVPTLVVHSRSDSRPQWPIPEKGTGMYNCIPTFGNGNGNEKLRSQLLGTGMGMKKSFPIFGNGNRRPVFPGMVGNGNSRSPLYHLLHLHMIMSFDHYNTLHPSDKQRWVTNNSILKEQKQLQPRSDNYLSNIRLSLL